MRKKNGRLYQLSHCTYRCNYHIVWTTKYRREHFKDAYVSEEMKRILKTICKWKQFEINAWHIGEEHVHLYISIPPKYSVSYAVNILKGKSSSWIKKKTKKLGTGSIWNRGYFVTTIGVSEQAVKRYVESHGKRLKDVMIPMGLEPAS